MAAGGCDIPRRRGVSRYSKIEIDHYKNGSSDKEVPLVLDHDFRRKNGFNCSSSDREAGHSKEGFYARKEEQSFGKLRYRSGVDESFRAEYSHDGVQLPPEKRRRFSPIIWDREQKEVRIVSKNRVVAATAVTSLTRDKTRGQELNGVASRCPDLENQIQVLELPTEQSTVVRECVEIPLFESSGSLVPSLHPENHENHVEERSHMEEDCVHARDISMSRWASDSSPSPDECLSDDEDMPRRRGVTCHSGYLELARERNSSPEPGELQREDSEGDWSALSNNEECGFRKSSSGDLSFENDYIDTITMDGRDKHDTINDDGDFQDIGEPTLRSRRSMNMLQDCRSVFEYEKLNKINEGTYGIVYRAKDLKTGEVVALKKVKMDIDRDGFPLSSLREINILSSFDHPSIVGVREVVMDDLDSVFLVMEYMEYDLKRLMEMMKQPFSVSEVKCLMIQLLEGVKYLHDNWVLHRDLKTSNLLLDKDGKLKICDFGLSRQYGSPLKPYTPLVVTMWYRAPELLLGTKQYSTAIDMWSVGCIMTELLTKEPLFRGKSEIDQLDKIFRTLGTPNDDIWPGFSKLPGVRPRFAQQQYNLLRRKFPATSFTGSPVLSDSGFELLNRLLTYDPERRITAEDALNHAWFRESPLPNSSFKPSYC